MVPPLAVVGLTLNAHQWNQAGGALLLFVTNVAAILGVGTIVMAIYGVHRMTPQFGSAETRALNRRNAVFVIAALAVIVVVPLTEASVKLDRQTRTESAVTSASSSWVKGTGWELVSVTTNSDGKTVAQFEGPLPYPDTAALTLALVKKGVSPAKVQAQFVPRATVNLALARFPLSLAGPCSVNRWLKRQRISIEDAHLRAASSRRTRAESRSCSTVWTPASSWSNRTTA